MRANIKNLYFFNCGGNGDIHLTREFCKLLVEEMRPSDVRYFHSHALDHRFRDICEDDSMENMLHEYLNKHLTPARPDLAFNAFSPHDALNPSNISGVPFILVDDPNSKGDSPPDKSLFLNTWIGAWGHFLKERANTEGWETGTEGCSLSNYIRFFNEALKRLGIPDLGSNESRFLPKINYDVHLKTDQFKLPFDQTKAILVDNADPSSNQSNFKSIKELTLELCRKLPDYNFITLNKITTGDSAATRPNEWPLMPHYKNLFCVDDFFEEETNLNHFSYLSLHCNTIIGRSSGPYVHTLVKENLLNSKKLFICFCSIKIESSWANLTTVAAQFVWLPYCTLGEALSHVVKLIRYPEGAKHLQQLFLIRSVESFLLREPSTEKSILITEGILKALHVSRELNSGLNWRVALPQ